MYCIYIYTYMTPIPKRNAKTSPPLRRGEGRAQHPGGWRGEGGEAGGVTTVAFFRFPFRRPVKKTSNKVLPITNRRSEERRPPAAAPGAERTAWASERMSGLSGFRFRDSGLEYSELQFNHFPLEKKVPLIIKTLSRKILPKPTPPFEPHSALGGGLRAPKSLKSLPSLPALPSLPVSKP